MERDHGAPVLTLALRRVIVLQRAGRAILLARFYGAILMTVVYGDPTGFRAYHTAHGRDVSTYTDDAKINAALLVASEWGDGKYRASFGGTKVGQRGQIREWPRNGAVDRDYYAIPADSVPLEMINTTYEAALRELITPGSLSVDWTPNKYKRAMVDGAVSVEYANFQTAQDIQTQFIVIDRIIAPILSGIENVSSLSGAVTRV